MLWHVHTAWQQEWTGTVNKTGTIGDNGSRPSLGPGGGGVQKGHK